MQFGLQFTAVRHRPWETCQGRWSSLNRSGRLGPELLMRLGPATRDTEAATHRPTPDRSAPRRARGPKPDPRNGRTWTTHSIRGLPMSAAGAGNADQEPVLQPICKPDAAGQPETGETEPTERDGICPVRRGHRIRERRLEMGETNVVWLITQRSRVQIPPPLPRPEALSRTEKGPSACGLLTRPWPPSRRATRQ